MKSQARLRTDHPRRRSFVAQPMLRFRQAVRHKKDINKPLTKGDCHCDQNKGLIYVHYFR